MLIKQSDISAVLMNKLCGEGGFIRVPEGAEYSAEDATNLLLHAATSSSNFIESAVQDLQAMHPISRIPCADTVHTYVKENDIDEMMLFFRKINSELIDITIRCCIITKTENWNCAGVWVWYNVRVWSG
ncbi:MAG: hypothetical protein C4B59_13435 [Candidatus Methanogaster sp.]|uniref:Uncharacterized protein n=1 Tax=Candidatus Methanogaster sp. TaxID=3386292 RepID=A0AC61KZS5_9EURY|nr:MAG: hypothetical protein C4B59_13435 [ANME-2 cluster archaeon]